MYGLTYKQLIWTYLHELTGLAYRVGNRAGRPTGAYDLAYIGSGQAGLFI
jgi:hypothetical protein